MVSKLEYESIAESANIDYLNVSTNKKSHELRYLHSK
jgi:hypothetical protein